MISGRPHYLFYEENYKWFVEQSKSTGEIDFEEYLWAQGNDLIFPKLKEHANYEVDVGS